MEIADYELISNPQSIINRVSVLTLRTMKWIFWFNIIMAGSFFLTSCHSSTTEEESKQQISSTSSFKEQAELDSLKAEIDSKIGLREVYSLRYLSSEDDVNQVFGLIDEELNISRLEHVLIPKEGVELQTRYYFQNGTIFLSTQLRKKFENEQFFLREIRTYYDENGVVLFTGERRASDETKLEERPWKKIAGRVMVPQKAMEIINQQGEFATNFLNLSEAMGKKYIVVGTDKQSSTVAYHDGISGDLKLLLARPDKFVNQPLSISFTEITDANDFCFQALKELKIVK